MREPADERPSWRQHDSSGGRLAIFFQAEKFSSGVIHAPSKPPLPGSEVRLLLHTTEDTQGQGP